MSQPGGGHADLWIVQASDELCEKLDEILKVRSIPQVQRVAADTVVVSMTPDSAEKLKAEFPDLIVEPNSSLDPFH
jgi:hypothetical protein